MTKALAGFRVIDATHVLAGPFASYQMAVLGAEVIKVEDPADPDQARLQGSDRQLSNAAMGTAFMAQGSNKKAVALNLKTESGRDVLKRLTETADVFVENYRPGAFDALGLGYEDLRKLNPGLVYCSVSAFGSTGPRREQTGYDSVLQAFSGLMAMTGDEDGDPLKCGGPVVDYATGTTAAYAVTAALLQRERNGGKGQFVDVSMLDVALILCSPYITGYLWNGSHPKPKGNRFPFATIGQYRASDADLMVAASNLEQQRRLWVALGREDLVKSNNDQRLDNHAEEETALTQIIATMPADYWESFLRERRIPAARVRQLNEALADPQIASRPLLHKHVAPGNPVDGLVVPVAAFTMSESEPGVSFPPQAVGAQTAELLREIGFDGAQLEMLRAEGAIK